MTADKKRGLGRGLSALLGEARPADGGATGDATRTVPIALIRAMPNQPRRRFDTEAQAELIESVRTRGVLQPILVRPVGESYEIVAGERRWRAAQAAQLHDMPVVVRDLDDAEAFELALVENIQRADLNPIEEAESYKRLIADYAHTQDALAQLVGKSRSHVANLLRLLDLPQAVRDLVIDGKLSMGHARAIAAAPDPESLAEQVVARGLSVRQAEALAAAARGRVYTKSAAPPRGRAKDADTRALESMLSESLGLTVAIEANALRIAYSDLDQLDMLCRKLTGDRF